MDNLVKTNKTNIVPIGMPGAGKSTLGKELAKRKNIEQITYSNAFDGFPMFTHDGKKLIFASNRFGKVRGETNVFIAEWIR